MTSPGRRWAPVAAVAAGGLATLVVLRASDPETNGFYPPCISARLFGVACPLCGGLRGMHDLLHGDVGAMIDHNALLPLYLVVLAALFLEWVRSRARGPSSRAMPAVRFAAIAVIVMSAGFGVLRNFVPYLAPAAG